MSENGIAILYSPEQSGKNVHSYERWWKDFIELQMIVEADAIPIAFQKASSISIVSSMLHHLQRDWSRYHGFVVTLPHDDFLFQADLLAFLMGDIGKPVLFAPAPFDEAAQSPFHYSDVQAKALIANAVQAAAGEFSGGLMALGPEITPITHLVQQKNAAEQLSILHSADETVYARVDFGVHPNKYAPEFRPKLKPRKEFDVEERVEQVTISANESKNTFTFRPQTTCALLIQQDENTQYTEPFKQITFSPASTPVLYINNTHPILQLQDKQYPLPQLTPAAAQAKSLWILGQLKRKRIKREDRGRLLLEGMSHEYIREFLRTPLNTPS